MTHPILYTFRRCPYAMRARMALYVSGAKVELREIELKHKPAEMLALSPKGTVPVLQLFDGTVLDESLDIMIYALGRQDPDEWLCADPETTHALIRRNDGDFKDALDRYKYPNRYPDEHCGGAFNLGAGILSALNARIAENGALVRDYSTLADTAIFPFVRQFRNVDVDRFHALGFDALSGWLDAHLESVIFTKSMEKYSVWERGSAPVIFPTPS